MKGEYNMLLQEPKVEFVNIDQSMFTTQASGCATWSSETPAGGGKRCVASQVDAHPCDDWDSEVPWT